MPLLHLDVMCKERKRELNFPQTLSLLQAGALLTPSTGAAAEDNILCLELYSLGTLLSVEKITFLL